MQNQQYGKLNIIVAVYGLKIVTQEVTDLITDGFSQTLSFTVNNYSIGVDGWRGQKKSITILYNYDGGELNVTTAKEGDVISINIDSIEKRKIPSTANDFIFTDGLSILAATYGVDDVTYKLKTMISQYNTISFRADNTVFGDSWYGVPKTLVVFLAHNNEINSVEIFTERELCYIDLNEVVSAI